MLFLGLFEIPLFVILIFCCLVLLYIYGKHPASFWNNAGVPSPPAIPFFGHMDRLFDPKSSMRYHIEQWTKQYGKIYGLLLFRGPCLCVTDLDALKEVLVKDFNNYVDRYLIAFDALWQPIVKKGVFFNGGQDWKRIRRIMSPSFSSGKLKYLTRHINTTSYQLVNALHKHVENGTHPEAKVIFSAYSLDALAATAFGLNLDSQSDINGAFYQHAKGMITIKPSLKIVLALAGMFPSLGFIFKMLNIRFMNPSDVNYFEKQLTKLVMERKADPDQFKETDFLQYLIKAEAESTEDIVGSNKLTTEEIVAQSIIFVLAGYETTSATLQWLTYELSKNIDIQKRLREEIDDVVGNEKEVTNEHCQKLKYMEAVINEALRKHPPVVTITRTAEKATTLKGYNVPAGTGIIIPIANIVNDPELFENPDTFNPDRFMDENKIATNLIDFLPFGFGPRQCIGMRLALLQLKIALVHVLRVFSIDGTSPTNVGFEDFSGLLVPKEPIHLILSKHNIP